MSLANPFPSQYEAFIFKSRYARWLEDQKRREDWAETVFRYVEYMKTHLYNKHKYELSEDLYKRVYSAIYNFEVMPSMRSMMTAGPALSRDNTCGYNCSYLPIDDVRSFDETMFILLCGAGVGFSVERQYINKLPTVPEKIEVGLDHVIKVGDSKEGWAEALRSLIELLYAGVIPSVDVSEVRPAGAKLKTFGGRASGPQPLLDLFNFVIRTFQKAQGRKLSSIECHDIVCKIGSIVVVGGVRRSALISLSNLTDDRMRKAKMGDWQTYEQQRYLANNSISFTEKPDVGSFMKEWNALYESKSGERGIFNRVASQKKAKENGRRIWDLDFGTNPCSEIILRPYQFCNLSEVVVRSGDTTEDLLRKVEVAAIIGTFQSTLTHFPYLRDIWTQNTEEERLLGVSLTGIMDRVWAKDGELALLKNKAIAINAQYAELLGIPVSTAITCVKPSGTVSQLVNSASGIHARYASWYARTVRGDNKDPMTQFLIAEGIPNEPAIDQPDDMTVFTFVQEAPESSFVTDDLSAIDQLNVWLKFQREWCEHKPSVTINVKEEEWPRVGAWVWDHFDEVSGISFLPLDDHVYQQAPYQKLEYEDYEVAKAQQDKIVLDWDKLSAFENGIDTTTVTQNLACSADSCEIVDIGG